MVFRRSVSDLNIALTLGNSESGNSESALPLDNISAVLAFSTARKLRTAYTGDAIRVRESGGDTEADIGFSGNALDESALTTHTGANDGLIATGYGQGAANNFTQSTAAAQPVIVASGTINKLNSKPAADFDGANDFLESATDLIDCTNGLCVAAVVNLDTTPGLFGHTITSCRQSFGTTSRFQFAVLQDLSIIAYISDGGTNDYIGRQTAAAAISTGTDYVVHFTYDGGTSASGVKIYVNGAQADTADFTDGTFTGPRGASGSGSTIIGSMFTGNVAFLDGLISEVVVVPDSSIGSLPANMMEFYGIS